MRAEVKLLVLFIALGSSLGSVSSIPGKDKHLVNESLTNDYTVSDYGVRVEAEIYATLSRKNQTRVVVILKPDSLPKKLKEKKNKIKKLQKQVFDKIPKFTPIHQYKTIPAFSGFVSSEVLKALEKNPRVERVYLDRVAMAALTESVPLINATYPQSRGFTGEGQGILVVDTGIDYTRPFLNKHKENLIYVYSSKYIKTMRDLDWSWRCRDEEAFPGMPN